jgi:hypothetical protein
MDNAQPFLFPRDPKEIAAAIDLNWWAVLKLYDDGWLSFNPESMITDDNMENEFVFLGSLVAAGSQESDRLIVEGTGNRYGTPFRRAPHSADGLLFSWLKQSAPAHHVEKIRCFLHQLLLRRPGKRRLPDSPMTDANPDENRASKMRRHEDHSECPRPGCDPCLHPACSVSNRMSHGESPNVLPQKCFVTIATSRN